MIGELAAKALLSGVLIAAISELGRRQPALGALVTSLPLVAILGMAFLWIARPDGENMARYSEATFWYVLPSLPMFLLIPFLLRGGLSFWFSLLLGCVLTVGLYALMIEIAARFGLKL